MSRTFLKENNDIALACMYKTMHHPDFFLEKAVTMNILKVRRDLFCDFIAMTPSPCLTKHCATLKPHNPEKHEFIVVQNCRSTDFKAQSLGNVWSGTCLLSCYHLPTRVRSVGMRVV